MEQVPVNGDYILTQNVRKRNGEWEIVANGVFFKRCLCDTTVEDDEEDGSWSLSAGEPSAVSRDDADATAEGMSHMTVHINANV